MMRYWKVIYRRIKQGDKTQEKDLRDQRERLRKSLGKQWYSVLRNACKDYRELYEQHLGAVNTCLMLLQELPDTQLMYQSPNPDMYLFWNGHQVDASDRTDVMLMLTSPPEYQGKVLQLHESIETSKDLAAALLQIKHHMYFILGRIKRPKRFTVEMGSVTLAWNARREIGKLEVRCDLA